MNLILFTKRGGKARSVCLTETRCYVPLALGVLVVAGGLFAGGYWAGATDKAEQVEQITTAWRQDVTRQARAVDEAREQTRAQIAALSRRIARLQAHTIRLDALGKRLVNVADLEEGEFHFEQPPAQGGPRQPERETPVSAEDLVEELDRLAAQFRDRENQLRVLETFLRNRRLQAAAQPEGRPIEQGWISSYYGWRTDPFTGKRERHDGIDFAGEAGSGVVAVAAGVVTWAGERRGYGQLVEVDHGNGYVTRYGHNQEILVQPGDRVEKGQQIAEMGSTGRSTGPHVHFEVRHHGRAINPSQYIRAER